MVRYLTSAWFERLRGYTGPADAPPAPGGDPEALVLRHVVRSPEPARQDDREDYDVVIAAGRAVIRHPTSGRADLTFTSDYLTAAAVASGRLSTNAALAEGRLRVAGDVSVLSRRSGDVAGLDPVPPRLRDETEF